MTEPMRTSFIILLAMLAMVSAASADPRPQAEEAAVTIDLQRASRSERAAGFGSLVFVELKILARIANNSGAPLRYALVSVQGYDTEAQVNINPDWPVLFKFLSDSRSILPYQSSPGYFKVAAFPDGLAAGADTEVNVGCSYDVFGAPGRDLSSLALGVAGYGGLEYGIQLTGNMFLPERKRQELAREVSRELGRRIRYLTDTGAWAFPDRSEDLPEADWSEQLAGSSLDFEKTVTGGEDATVEISNGSDQVISLSVMGNGVSRHFALAPGRTDAQTLAPGVYSFAATAANCWPHSGAVQWDAGSSYTWKFWISRDGHGAGRE